VTPANRECLIRTYEELARALPKVLTAPKYLRLLGKDPETEPDP